MPTANRVTFRSSLVFGALLSISSVGLVTIIVLIVTAVGDGFRSAIFGFGVALLIGAIAMMFTPLFGLLVSLSNGSWYAFKVWSASGAVAMILNFGIGTAAIGASYLVEPESNVEAETKTENKPTQGNRGGR